MKKVISFMLLAASLLIQEVSAMERFSEVGPKVNSVVILTIVLQDGIASAMNECRVEEFSVDEGESWQALRAVGAEVKVFSDFNAYLRLRTNIGRTLGGLFRQALRVCLGIDPAEYVRAGHSEQDALQLVKGEIETLESVEEYLDLVKHYLRTSEFVTHSD